MDWLEDTKTIIACKSAGTDSPTTFSVHSYSIFMTSRHLPLLSLLKPGTRHSLHCCMGAKFGLLTQAQRIK